jgi:hypothetical protein
MAIEFKAIVGAIRALDRTLTDIEARDVERWTLLECSLVEESLNLLGIKASALYIHCMTDDEMAEIEAEEDDEYGE